MKTNLKERPIIFSIIGLLVLINLAGCATPPPPATPTAIPVPTNIPTPTLDPNRPHPIFPGAEGFGVNTIGGRGGEILQVTNLDDSGPGSLRAAIEKNEPRIIVFQVAGTIELKTSLVISNPFITIAGQTAPGAGITLRDVSADVEGLIEIQTHDVVIQYLTFRAGPPSAGDAVEILTNDFHDTYNIVINHNSMSWAVNRILATWYDVHDVDIQWNIFAEGLNCSVNPKGCHSKGVLLGGYASDENNTKPGAYNISFHHNLMTQDGERNPYVEAAGIIDIVNNVSYNPFGTFSHIDMVDQLAPDLVNYIGNYYKPGTNTDVKYGIRAINPGTFGAKIFVQGNIGPSRPNNDLPDKNILDPDARLYMITAPNPAPAITTTSALDAYDQVLANAGANIGLNCDGTSFTRQDAIDQRVIADVKNGTGKIIDDPSQVGGWLTIAPAAGCADADKDGMPDAWEQKYGFNPNDPSDASKDANNNGYTNIEEFLNGTDPLK